MNTETTRDSIRMLQDVSQNVFKGQIAFEQYLRKEHAMNDEFEALMNESKQAGDEMRRAIDRI